MKKVSFEEKVNFDENLRTPQILTKETYIMRRFLMENSKNSLDICRENKRRGSLTKEVYLRRAYI